MKRFLSLLVVGLTVIMSACGDRNVNSSPYQEKMDLCMNTLLESRDDSTGIWPHAGWWNSANLLTAVIRYADVNGQKERFEVLLQDVFRKTRTFPVYDKDGRFERICTNYVNDYYDDEGWWALAWIEAYKLTRNQEYLNMAETIFKDMTTGWSKDVLGGGIFWRKNPLAYKNSIANNLFALTAVRLFDQTRDEKYMKWFEDEVNWYLSTGMYNTESDLIEDGMKDDGQPNRGAHYTYNQGVAIAVLTEMYLHKMDHKYLDMAEKIAKSCITRNLITEDGILREMNTKVAAGNDGVQFKGIFMRHLAFLYRVTKNPVYKDFIIKNADSILANNYDETSKSFGCYWYGPFKAVNMAANSSALECVIEAHALFK